MLILYVKQCILISHIQVRRLFKFKGFRHIIDFHLRFGDLSECIVVLHYDDKCNYEDVMKAHSIVSSKINEIKQRNNML